METPIFDETVPSGASLTLAEANKGKRLLNYLIDAVAIGLLQTVFTNIFEGLAAINAPSFFEGYKVVFGFNLVTTPLYYILMEYTFNGKSIGKWVTGTRVVTLDGDQPSFQQLIGRSFARMIPFEPLSFLGDKPNGWHDRLSGTIVVDEKESSLPIQDQELV